MVSTKSGYIPLENLRENASTPLYHTLFVPQTVVRATLMVIHGMQEHSGRYHDFAHYLAEQGIAVLVYDHLGHGHTALQAEGLGFFHVQHPHKRVIDDARSVGRYLEGLYPGLPHFVLGHSMGSFVARCLLQEEASRFAGAILMGSGARTPEAYLSKFCFTLASALAPKYRSRFVNQTFSRMNNKAFKNEIQSNGTNWLSADIGNRERFLADPLCGVDFTINGFYTLLTLHVRATDRDWAIDIPKHFPMYFVSGQDDPIGDFGAGVRKTVAKLQSDGFTAVDVKLYPSMRHEILHERDRLAVYVAIADWLALHY